MNGFDSYRVRERAEIARAVLIGVFLVLAGAFFRTQVIQHEKFQLRAETNRLRPISLTATEFELLRYLMRNPRRVLSKAQILDRVWNYDFGGQANVVELYISYLRKKIDAGETPMIHTVRGVGYVIKPTS